MAQIEIDGKQVEVKDGSTVMDAARQAGIYIPHFCYHKKLSIAANCRMCLVQVEKAPKPLPACATPVTDGMKVMTRSESAIRAQKGVMEFLLINHPLDCPICDQGGECQLQDLALGYGGVASRYDEEKRVVSNKELGPLISTDMTRCIHCTRCVRFGQEIAGLMELGQAGRGEHSEIMPFVERTVNSELSGNMIDLCPVGALTSKPFRYTARAWELTRRASISPHDSLGSNLAIHVKNNRVMRVLPRENDEINECWIADKDRYSYEALNSEQRLTQPMIKRHGEWQECDWQTALEFVSNGLKRIRDDHGANEIGALATPHSTLEELFLLQKFVRGLGSGNIDHRVSQSDFSADGDALGAPWLGQNIVELQDLDRILVIGSNLRKENPLIAHRLRQAVKKGGQLSQVNMLDEDLLCKVANSLIVSPANITNSLAEILKAIAEIKQESVPGNVEGVLVSDEAKAIAVSLSTGSQSAILLGGMSLHHPRYKDVHALAQEIARLSGAKLGILSEAANSVGAYIAGAVPFSGAMGQAASVGMNAGDMLKNPRLAYILLNTEVELDCYDPQLAAKAMEDAELVVAMTAFRHQAVNYADVMLPVAPFAETSGTFVNTEGRAQSFSAVVKPSGETRPAWKVLRVLGNMFNLHGFEYNSTEDVRLDVLGATGNGLASTCNNQLNNISGFELSSDGKDVYRIGDVPIYQSDALVRRADSLQRTVDGAAPEITMNSAMMRKFELDDGGMAVVRQGTGSAVMRARCNDRLPMDCVRVPASHPMTSKLGAMFGSIAVEKA